VCFEINRNNFNLKILLQLAESSLQPFAKIIVTFWIEAYAM
jgi:hypothetical protein